MKVYYNEHDKKKCAALRQLMIDGHISYGDIDDRPIQEVMPDDLREYTRCHFFAGIGLWDYALDLAGWGENRRVWTGSCPCQPFSSAGRQVGKGDDRHLWPEWFRLIEKCRPPTIFGEQVSAAIAQGWLDDVYQGLEKEEYAVGSVVLPASAVGAPHRRERLWFVAYSNMHRREEDRGCVTETRGDGFIGNGSTLGNTESVRGRIVSDSCKEERFERSDGTQPLFSGPGHWDTGIWIDCPDGKQRLIEPSIPLLAHGFPERVGVIHCAGDAIVPQVAAEFIKAAM